MRKQKYIFIVGVIFLFAFGGLLFAKPGEGQSSHRGRGRGQSERGAPAGTEVTPTPNPQPSPNSSASEAQLSPPTTNAAEPPTSPSNATNRRERIRKKFRKELAEETDRRTDTDEIKIIVRYKIPAGEAHFTNMARRGSRIKKRFKHFSGAAVTVKKSDLFSEIFDDGNIASLELDLPVTPHLNTSLPAIAGAAIEKNYSVTGKGVKVAIVDSGISKNHPALAGKVAAEFDQTGEGPADLNGHGTHVACIVACGDSTYRGVAPDVSLYNAKVLNQTGSGYISDVIAGVEWAIDQKVDVMNLSIGAFASPCDGTDALSYTVDKAFDAGILPVVSAGNSGPTAQTVASPGCAQKALTVGAVYDQGAIAEFSSRGPTGDGRVKPDVAAAGVDIFAADMGSAFVSKSGTSMAAPHVSGVAALLKQMNPAKNAADIKNLILKTASPLSYDSNTSGNGYLNADKALQSLKSEVPAPTPAPPEEPVTEEPIVEPAPPETPQEPPVEESPEPEPEKSISKPRGNLLSQCLRQMRGKGKERKEGRRECLEEYIPGAGRGLQNLREEVGEKIPEKELKSIERILLQIPVPVKESGEKIGESVEKRLERFSASLGEKSDAEVKKEIKKLKSSLKQLKRRAKRKAKGS